MGTASTMACLTVALGLIPLNGASAPAVSSTRLRIAEQTGVNAVRAATEKRTPQSILSVGSFLNAAIVLQAIGGSTNAMVHLIAIANRHPKVNGKVSLQTLDEIGRKAPLLVDLKPSGDNYMNDFHNAGGMMCLLYRLRPLLRLSAQNIFGKTLGETLDDSPFHEFPYASQVIRPLSNPLKDNSSLIIVSGKLAPHGAVIKASASKDKRLLTHSGPAVVFKNSYDMAQRLDDPNLDVTPDSVLMLQSIGPIGNPGMPEAGMLPIPRKLGAQGVTDMLRISDGRMSGTAGGTIVLHVSPESALPESVFGIVRDGDIITLDGDKRLLQVEITEEEIQSRMNEARLEKTQLSEQAQHDETRKRGYRWLYENSVNQAHEGADFSFLTAKGPGNHQSSERK